MANSRDFTGKNRKFTGTKGVVMPKGSTAERADTESGEIRFNTTTELMEYYDGNQWKPIDAPPTISAVTTSDSVGTNTVLNADGSSLFTITITGGNFSLNPTVRFIGSTGTEYTPGNITRVSASSITCTTLITMGTTDDPYDVRVTNTSGLSATLDDAFSFNAPPVFTVASGQLGTVYNNQVISGTTLNAGATDAEGNSITHTIISGALPGTGLTLSSSTGAITGTLAGTPSLGNYSFVVRAATTEGVRERQFSIQVVAAPTLSFLVVAGGGGNTVGQGGNRESGAGAGGLRTSFGATSGRGSSAEAGIAIGLGTYTITVGSGTSGTGNPSSIAAPGMSTITSNGGGSGANSDGAGGGSGGCGGGAWYVPAPGGAGTAGQGYDGSPGFGGPEYGGAGGGAGGAGGRGASVGAGLSVSITGSAVTYSVGGQSNDYPSTTRNANGSSNTGNAANGAASGGSGVVVLRMLDSIYSGTTSGSPTVNTNVGGSGETVIIFTGSGSYTG